MKLIYEIIKDGAYNTELRVWDEDRKVPIDLTYTQVDDGDDEVYLCIGLWQDYAPVNTEDEDPNEVFKTLDGVISGGMETVIEAKILKQFFKDHGLFPSIDFERYGEDYNMDVSFDREEVLIIGKLIDKLLGISQ